MGFRNRRLDNGGPFVGNGGSGGGVEPGEFLFRGGIGGGALFTIIPKKIERYNFNYNFKKFKYNSYHVAVI